ncbi:MAG: TetR/AcrR family transcriptional regulator [Limnobacter sp.]|nr:TetR/AcrR family transcriptional regulator [Limnobacter sp.]
MANAVPRRSQRNAGQGDTGRRSATAGSATTRSTAARAPAAAAARRPGVRELAAQASRENILRAAVKVFARHGYEGGRIEKISRAAKSYDRMIYYYFGSKEALFIAVIEEIYRRFNEAEARLEIDSGDPVGSLQTIVRFVWSYYRRNPEFITLLNVENLHRGKHISKSRRAGEYSSPTIGLLDGVLRSGMASGDFRPGLNARDVYLMIASLGYFYLSNRHTLSVFLNEQLETPEALAHWERFIIDAVMRQVSPALQPAHADGD